MELKTESIEIKKLGDVRLLYYPHKSYLTNIQILTDVGSAVEDDRQQGLAHILEHMFFKGSLKRAGGTAISRAANRIGAKMNAYTTYDHTVYYISVLNDVFEEGFDILADMYLNPLFPPEEFAKELNPILSELREREDDPENFLIERAFSQYFGKDYHPIIGTEESVRGASVEMMHSFKKDFYGGENCLISIVGGVSKEKAFEAVEKFFLKDFSASKKEKKRLQPKLNAGRLELKKEGIREAYCHFLFPALESRHPERFKQDMMNYLLGGNDSSLLFERIREDLGMSCYGIYSWVMRNEPFTSLGISCGIAVEEIEKLEKEVEGQIERICEAPLTEDRLKQAKASLRSSIAARSETSAGLNSMIALPVLRGEKENPIQKALKEIEAVELSDVLELARQSLRGPCLKSFLRPT